ncbi:MAG: L-serine dehydratase [Saprospiraceae bacterium]|jgi:L-serine dehydratase
MELSVLDLFKIGIGPSSSHTVGPMVAAWEFVAKLTDSDQLKAVSSIEIELYGSLGATGRGHNTDRAILLGLLGHHPKEVDPKTAYPQIDALQARQQLLLGGTHRINFIADEQILFMPEVLLEHHVNAMKVTAVGADGNTVLAETYYSTGGGFIENHSDIDNASANASHDFAAPPNPFYSANELLQRCNEKKMSISDIMLENELDWREELDLMERIDEILQAMSDCIDNGMITEGILPGGLNVKRRASSIARAVAEKEKSAEEDPLKVLDWINIWAMAVNEENANGQRMVTAPTNGAAGIIPAVLRYYLKYHAKDDPHAGRRFVLTAAAIGKLCKLNGSISGAEVGCQGEVGSACAMAAAGLAEGLGGTPEQVENAAEIAMEHHLGLTCDPIAGLVQVPCIERNAIAAVHAIDSARLAMAGDGTHFVSFDDVLQTMLETGKDMQNKYKETSTGGLAVTVNFPEC